MSTTTVHPQATHRITWDKFGSATFHCDGNENSACRNYPNCGCEEWSTDNTAPDGSHIHPEVPQDECWILPWLENLEYPEDAFIDDGELMLRFDGLIETEYDDGVLWRYANTAARKLAEIRARVEAAPHGTWYVVAGAVRVDHAPDTDDTSTSGLTGPLPIWADGAAELIANAPADLTMLTDALAAVLALADKWEYGATRWHDPLPVPVEVEQIRNAVAAVLTGPNVPSSAVRGVL